MAGRGSPSGAMDPKVRMGQPHPPSQGQQYYYPNNNMNSVDPSSQFNPMQQQNGPQGQTINFTQQHLRMGGPTGPSTGNMAPRMGVPPNMGRIPGPGPRPGPPGQPQQQPTNPQQQQQQQMMMRQQHMSQQAMSQQQLGNMGGQQGMINRFPGKCSHQQSHHSSKGR